MKQRRLRKVSSIETILSQPNSALTRLARKARSQETATEELRGLVGAPLAQHVSVARLDQLGIVVVADSPAWASRCRYAERQILAHFRVKATVPAQFKLTIRTASEITAADDDESNHSIWSDVARKRRQRLAKNKDGSATQPAGASSKRPKPSLSDRTPATPISARNVALLEDVAAGLEDGPLKRSLTSIAEHAKGVAKGVIGNDARADGGSMHDTKDDVT